MPPRSKALTPSALSVWQTFQSSTISRTFALMGEAEEELALTYPKKRGEPAGIFALLVPPTGMVDFIPALYRAHVKQTLWRVQHRMDTCVGTDAEVLMHLSRASLKAPLARPYDEIFMWCAARCGFQLKDPAWSETNAKELSLSAVEELNKARAKVRVEGRSLE